MHGDNDNMDIKIIDSDIVNIAGSSEIGKDIDLTYLNMWINKHNE